jgi:hypothetical protein
MGLQEPHHRERDGAAVQELFDARKPARQAGGLDSSAGFVFAEVQHFDAIAEEGRKSLLGVNAPNVYLSEMCDDASHDSGRVSTSFQTPDARIAGLSTIARPAAGESPEGGLLSSMAKLFRSEVEMTSREIAEIAHGFPADSRRDPFSRQWWRQHELTLFGHFASTARRTQVASTARRTQIASTADRPSSLRDAQDTELRSAHDSSDSVPVFSDGPEIAANENATPFDA